jgi:TRAP-type C4-dicarboxylate transport system substrate-binding protein
MNKYPISTFIAEGPILRTLVALLLAVAAVSGSWQAVAALLILGSIWTIKYTVDKMFPEAEPEPTAAEMFAALQKHREETELRINNLSGKIEIRSTARMLRE